MKNLRMRLKVLRHDSMYLCASICNVGKTSDHEKALALLCVPELEFRMHTQFRLFHSMDTGHCDL